MVTLYQKFGARTEVILFELIQCEFVTESKFEMLWTGMSTHLRLNWILGNKNQYNRTIFKVEIIVFVSLLRDTTSSSYYIWGGHFDHLPPPYSVPLNLSTTYRCTILRGGYSPQRTGQGGEHLGGWSKPPSALTIVVQLFYNKLYTYNALYITGISTYIHIYIYTWLS